MKNIHTQTITASILMLIGLTLVYIPQNAFAAVDCNHWLYGRCYADLTYSNSDLTGSKYTIEVNNLVTSSCPHSSHATVTGWVIFPNGDFIESGISQGTLDGTCYNSENRYIAWDQTPGSYDEVRIAAASTGTNQSFEISNTDGDTDWDVYNNGVNYATLIMQTSTTSNLRVGEEGTNSATSIPNTHIGDIQRRLASWADLSSGTPHEEPEQSTWIKHDCTPNYNHVHVGIEGSESCTE